MLEDVLISALNHYSFCPRRCALIHIDGVFMENKYTVEGALQHQNADTPGYESQPGAKVLRALPLFSHKLALAGQADIVELRKGIPYPIDYKRGKRHAWDNDEIQLCAQALCLEEMFGCPVEVGAIFHAASKRRREVQFTAALRQMTLETIEAVRALVHQCGLPPAVRKPQCEGCSLKPICLPELTREMVHTAAQNSFRTEG